MNGALWLALDRGPDPAWVERRRAWWRAQEASFWASGAVDVEPPGMRIEGAQHAACDGFLPIEVLARDAGSALWTWFGADLARLGVDLGEGELARSRSWLDARARLPSLATTLVPSELLARLTAPGAAHAAHALLFELFAPPSRGSTPGRYPEALDALVARAPATATLRAWDVGCGTGEGTWELGLALAHAPRVAVEVVGTTPCPLSRLMAERGARPHDPVASARLRDLIAGSGEAARRVQVRFVAGDVRREAPAGGPFDVVTCHGLLGEGIDDPAGVEAAVATIASALAPGGVLSVTDRFRADRARSARELVSQDAMRAGLAPQGRGLFVRANR